MRRRPRTRCGLPPWLVRVAAVLGLCVLLLSGCQQAAGGNGEGNDIGGTAGSLPGQRIWQKGVSSYLFGINQTYDWASANLENMPAAQQALRGAGFTLIRTFFNYHHGEWPYDHSTTTDADLERRLSAIEHSGAQCLGVLAVSGDPQYDSPRSFLDHVLTYAETTGKGNRCRMWEFGNEPLDKLSMDQYLARWNADVPYLRARHPHALFFGPVLAGPYFDQMRAFLMGVKQSGVLPDGVTYHDYPCYSNPDYYNSYDSQSINQGATCDQEISQGGNYLPSYAQRIAQMKQLVREVLGKSLPVGITEWNVSPNFVNLVRNPTNGQSYAPLTADARYQPHFIAEIYAAMEQGGLDFAAEFAAMSGAGEGTAGSLDLFESNGTPKPWLDTFTEQIRQARS
jgi:hypothetical protein